MAVGEVFSTGNEVINRLPIGATFVRVGTDFDGNAEVEVLAEDDDIESVTAEYEPGDRISTKYGLATVVGVSSRLSVTKPGGAELGDEYVLYVADSDPVVRRVKKSSL